MATHPTTNTLDLSSRSKYLRITSQDVHQLVSLWPYLSPRLDNILDIFYKHLATIPELAHFFKDRVSKASKKRKNAIGNFHSQAASTIATLKALPASDTPMPG